MIFEDEEYERLADDYEYLDRMLDKDDNYRSISIQNDTGSASMDDDDYADFFDLPL